MNKLKQTTYITILQQPAIPSSAHGEGEKRSGKDTFALLPGIYNLPEIKQKIQKRNGPASGQHAISTLNPT
jgi:hypothetical protein